MVFDLDADLTEDFNNLFDGKKKKNGKKVADFEFSRETAAKLNLGFDEVIGEDKDPIAVGHKRVIGGAKKSIEKGRKRR